MELTETGRRQGTVPLGAIGPICGRHRAHVLHPPDAHPENDVPGDPSPRYIRLACRR